MNLSFEESPSEESLRILECLRVAVANALERKQRLGQYAVVWEDGYPAFIGGDPSRKEIESDRKNAT